MNTYKVTLEIRAECQDGARELLNGFTGKETDIDIKEMLLMCPNCEHTGFDEHFDGGLSCQKCRESFFEID